MSRTTDEPQARRRRMIDTLDFIDDWLSSYPAQLEYTDLISEIEHRWGENCDPRGLVAAIAAEGYIRYDPVANTVERLSKNWP